MKGSLTGQFVVPFSRNEQDITDFIHTNPLRAHGSIRMFRLSVKPSEGAQEPWQSSALWRSHNYGKAAEWFRTPAGPKPSMHHNTSVANNFFSITAHISRCGVLDEFRLPGTQGLNPVHHRDGRAIAAHGNGLCLHGVIEPFWLQCQNACDGFLVFDPSGSSSDS